MEGLECDRSTGPALSWIDSSHGLDQILLSALKIWEDLLTTKRSSRPAFLSHTKHNLVALIRF
jgi:hypothetical protein